MPALFLFDIGEKRQKYQFLQEKRRLAHKLLKQEAARVLNAPTETEEPS